MKMRLSRLLHGALILVLLLQGSPARSQDKLPFRNSNLSLEDRVSDLIQRLTLEEKISLLGYNSRPVPRLGIPAYNWWNEALHGVARAGEATVFPQAIAMAASFDDELMKQCADVISTEARAKYNLAVQKGRHQQYMGLTFWSPNINLFRDPRWGRGQETYGEDPFLTSVMGNAFVAGLQGPDKDHLKVAACAKHFAVHSGPESERHGFNAVVSERDLRETYLYAFHKLVEGGVEAVMCAYNRVNDEPCCTSNTLLQDILRKEWNFQGHVVTDCWALQDIYDRHKSLPNSTAVAAAAIKAGINMDCSNLLQDDVMKAIQQNLLTEAEVDRALIPILRTQVKLGFFDPSVQSPYAGYGADSIANDSHRKLARKMAAESMVLLKNDRQLLPLDQNKYNAYMVLGPNAMSLDALLGSYHGVSSQTVNFVEGITAAVDKGARVEYDMGCNFTDTTHFGGIWAAGNADVTIAVLGFTPVYEGEEGDAFLAEGGGDRIRLGLPPAHVAYLKALRKGTRTPIVAVITAGSAVDVSEIAPYADAIVLAWYPGEQGGNALADILFGKVSPSGRLPVTFYNSLQDIPAYDNYAMKGRTYRYFVGDTQYPFGFGLSYTHFKYEWASTPVIRNDSISFDVKVVNDGACDGGEVVQVYVQYPAGPDMPVKELKAFRRTWIPKGQEVVIRMGVPLEELKKWDEGKHAWVLTKGNYQLVLGPNSASRQLSSEVNLRLKAR